jgi:uncharacterized membrane protein
MKIHTVFALLTAILSIALTDAAWSAPHYSITDVGPAASLLGFNEHGEVLGFDAQYNLFTYKHGIHSEIVIPEATISACGYESPPPFTGPLAGAINDDGDIGLSIPEYYISNDDIQACLVVLRNGTFTITGRGDVNSLTGIDGADNIIYNTFELVDVGGGAKCSSQQDPGDGDYAYAYYGINNRGTIVGTLYAFIGRPTNNPGAMVCRNGNAYLYKDVGSLSSQASAINDFGLATGYVLTEASISHAALFDDRKTIDIGALSPDPSGDSFGTGINDVGEVVGIATFSSSVEYTPFVYYGHHMHELESLIDERDPLQPYVQLTDWANTVLINNSGDIAVTGNDSRTNELHIYVLHPRDTDYRGE